MKTRIFSLLIAFILLVFFVNTQAQSDKKDKSKNKSKIILKVVKQSIPNDLNPGQSFALEVNIENNSKNSNWNSSSLTYDVDFPFNVASGVTQDYQSMVILSPGESKSFYFTVIAPVTNGKEKFKMVFYNDGKKKKQVVKMINIVTVYDSNYEKLNKKDD